VYERHFTRKEIKEAWFIDSFKMDVELNEQTWNIATN
jgi:hypothetical protein